MGRVLSGASTGAAGATLLASNGLPLIGGQLPLFGTGRALLFYASNGEMTFIPKAVRHRIRVLGGGSSCLADGQSSSFANLISATGGKKPNGLIGGVGGIGIGGDLQASGGQGGAGYDGGAVKAGGGGGAAGSQLGAGGRGGDGGNGFNGGVSGAGGGGGAVGGNRGANGTAAGGGFGSSVYSTATSTTPGTNIYGDPGPLSVQQISLPYFQFTGGADGGSGPSGPGAGGSGGGRVSGGSVSSGGKYGVWGGGGGGSAVDGPGGSSSFGGGQGGSAATASLGGGGGGGFALGEFDLLVDQPYAITIAQIVTSQASVSTSVGLVIVEW